MDIGFFTNDRFKVLECMHERQIDISGKKYVPLSQREIAKITGIAYKTVNNIIKDLTADKYISREGKTRGKYSLESKAEDVLLTMKKEDAQR
jgi:predicted transcriptional regulator